MSRIGRAAYRVGVIAASIAFGAALPAPAMAQAGTTDRTVQSTAGSNPQGARKPAKPSDAAKKTISTQPAARNSNVDAWTINHALPSGSKAVQSDSTTGSSLSNLGRMQLETGSFGVETESRFKDNKFSDGRTVPGLETDKRAGSSYFGLSLQLPTSGNTLIPSPIAPRREE
jgi:hypothetical protein